MTELSAKIRLRPTRIGFLVNPNDMHSLRQIMRACACVWGGEYNPIIPVFRTAPKDWKPRTHYLQMKATDITKGYIKFFEPDVLVESESGLLERAGLGALREKYTDLPEAVGLDDFLTPREYRDWAEPAVGLSILDVFHDLYEKERRFKLRKERQALLIKPSRSDCRVEAIFGAYPQQKDIDYLQNNFRDVLEPLEIKASPDAWLSVFDKGALTPLRLTRYGLDTQRYWYHDPVIYVFDPKKSTDLIDLWNLRLEPHPVLPIPLDWFAVLTDPIKKRILAGHRSVKGASRGVMHETTIEFSRSIGEERAKELVKELKGLPVGAFSVKLGRTPIWIETTDPHAHRHKRLEVTYKEHQTSLTVKESTPGRGKTLTTQFEVLEPDFAARFGGRYDRWVNVVRISYTGFSDKIGTVFPFNTFDRRWPRLGMGGDRVAIGSEGWVFRQRFKNFDRTIWLPTREEAVIGSLKERGIEASLSEPGFIAQQMLEQLGSLWGAHLLADLETLQLLNSMAGGVRVRTNDTDTVKETFERRTAPLKTWIDLISRRKEKHSLRDIGLADFTDRNVIRLGLETDCTNCRGKNWHSLTSTDYALTCERCLNKYYFPQASLLANNKNWHYRVVGPFSVPDYGRGAYSTLLTLRLIKTFSGTSFDEMTFSTAMNLKFDGKDVEVDFVAWKRKEGLDVSTAPDLVIGEAKSLGQGDLIKRKDLDKLKLVADKLPGSIIVLSILRDHFTNKEKDLLRPFVKWGRRPDVRGEPSNPVVLLTTHELFTDHFVTETWKKLDEPHKSFTDHYYTETMKAFAEATQRIYLGLPSYDNDRRERWRKRAAKAGKLRPASTPS